MPASLTRQPSAIAAIALGGNLGNVAETFEQAILAIQNSGRASVLQRSRSFRTRAIGTQAGSDYCNAAVLLETTCTPRELLALLLSIENRLGRIRTGHWSPRTLDLDLLSYGSNIIRETTSPHPLFVPHPACWYRRFVLDPWVEIAPGWRHPLLHETVLEMRNRLLERPLPFRITGSNNESSLLQQAIFAAFDSGQVRLTAFEEAAVEFRFETALVADSLPSAGRTIPVEPCGIIAQDDDQYHPGVGEDRNALQAKGMPAVQTAILTLRAMLDSPTPSPDASDAG